MSHPEKLPFEIEMWEEKRRGQYYGPRCEYEQIFIGQQLNRLMYICT